MQLEWRVLPLNPNFEVSNNGDLRNIRTKIVRKRKITPDGYVNYSMHRLEGDSHSYKSSVTAHRAVASAFMDVRPDGFTIDHIDGDKENNNVTNLEYIDRTEQMFRAYNLGLKKPMAGTKNANSKLSEDDVRYIQKHYKKGQKGEFSSMGLAKKFGVTHRVILLAAKGKSYKNV